MFAAVSEFLKPVFIGQVFNLNMFDDIFTLSFQFVDMRRFPLDQLTQSGGFFNMPFYVERRWLFDQDECAELPLFPGKLCGSFAHLGIKFAPLGIYDLHRIIYRLGLIINKSVQIKVFSGLLKEILLIPSSELRACNFRRSCLPFRTDNRYLMSAIGKSANFTNPYSFFCGTAN